MKKDEMGRDDYIRRSGGSILTFQEFCANRIPLDSAIAPRLREVWNQAVESACEYFGSQEGTDYGAREALIVDESVTKP